MLSSNAKYIMSGTSNVIMFNSSNFSVGSSISFDTLLFLLKYTKLLAIITNIIATIVSFCAFIIEV